MRHFLSVVVALLVAGWVHAQPAAAVHAALEDCRTLAPDEQKVTRYLWQPGGLGETDEAVLSLHLNLLSRSPVLRRVRQVNDALLAFALDDYGFDPKVWEKLLDVPEVYFSLTTEEVVTVTKHWPGGVWRREDGGDGKPYAAGSYTEKQKRRQTSAYDYPGTKELQARTGSLIPLVRADWFFQQTCRQVSLRNRDNGVGYYNFVGVKNRSDFLVLIGYDPKRSEERKRRVQDIVELSGVSNFPRFVVGERAEEGDVFHTLDEDTLDLANLPTEFLKPGVFKHKAEEWFGIGPNRLPKFLLADAAGALQPSAPDFIGPDDSPLRHGRDGKIHVNESCLNCHFSRAGDDGMRPVDGWVRRVFRKEIRANIVGRADALEFDRLYLSDLNGRLAGYRATARSALKELLGEEAEWHVLVAAYAKYRDRYRAPVDAKRLALEMGMRPDELLVRLRERSVPLSLANLLRDGGVVRREVVEDFMSTIMLGMVEVKPN